MHGQVDATVTGEIICTGRAGMAGGRSGALVLLSAFFLHRHEILLADT